MFLTDCAKAYDQHDLAHKSKCSCYNNPDGRCRFCANIEVADEIWKRLTDYMTDND